MGARALGFLPRPGGARETADSAAEFITEQGYEFPAFYDTDFQAAAAYQVYSIPATYFLDADGCAIALARRFVLR